MLSVAPILIALVTILLATHLLCLLVVGRWLKPDTAGIADRIQRGRARCYDRAGDGSRQGVA